MCELCRVLEMNWLIVMLHMLNCWLCNASSRVRLDVVVCFVLTESMMWIASSAGLTCKLATLRLQTNLEFVYISYAENSCMFCRWLTVVILLTKKSYIIFKISEKSFCYSCTVSSYSVCSVLWHMVYGILLYLNNYVHTIMVANFFVAERWNNCKYLCLWGRS